ncbi:hypothetical protein [Rhodopirellula bahusiensis]|uniref:hypothetical protein n=1 Tax=Rhodopirellula bahusiensis TaxID=2014065 RepID=UPI0032650A6E
MATEEADACIRTAGDPSAKLVLVLGANTKEIARTAINENGFIGGRFVYIKRERAWPWASWMLMIGHAVQTHQGEETGAKASRLPIT